MRLNERTETCWNQHPNQFSQTQKSDPVSKNQKLVLCHIASQYYNAIKSWRKILRLMLTSLVHVQFPKNFSNQKWYLTEPGIAVALVFIDIDRVVRRTQHKLQSNGWIALSFSLFYTQWLMEKFYNSFHFLAPSFQI